MKASVSGVVMEISKFFSKKKEKDVFQVRIYEGSKSCIDVMDYPDDILPSEGEKLNEIPVNIFSNEKGFFVCYRTE